MTQFGVNTGGGFTDQHSREYLIRNIGRTTNLDDLRNVVVAQVNDGPVYLRQVATVEFAPKVKRGDAGYMGKPAVVVSVEKQPNVDTVTLTREIEQALKEITATLPHGHQGRPDPVPAGRTSSKPRSAMSSGCCSRRASSSPSCCSLSC